jgi:hypothetical protein
MAPSAAIKSALLKPLSALSVVQKGGAAYYRELKNSPDRFVAAGAWCAMLDGKLMARAFDREVLALCQFGAVRSRAFTYFQSAFEHSLARTAAETPTQTRGDLEQAAMLAELAHDDAAAAEAAGALYLATGDIIHLGLASEKAEAAGGWRPGLEWALRAVVIAPLSAMPIKRLFAVLEASMQPDLLEEIAEIFVGRNLHLQTAQLFLAEAAHMRGDPRLCLTRLRPLDDAKVIANPVLKPYLGAIRALRAQSEEKLGEYRKAYDAYVALNEAERSPEVDPTFVYKGAEIRGKLAIPKLRGDGVRDVVQMLGFPRSGTTLLENVLGAHPAIETFEETPALFVAIDRIERVLVGKVPSSSPEQVFLDARAAYVEELLTLRRKPEATVLIDKMPIRTADTAFISKLFPEWRYIFSIRHPYDVVLSCFKQRFVPNPSMENFHTIADAARLYDFSMSEWFKHHTMDDPAVHYVRYDELVTDFERVTAGALEFLGVPWDDAVRDFSKSAEQRAAKTPSYQKVRQGLSIGVQTQWRNYGFVFQSDAAKPLRKWVEFFGYPLE